MADPLHSYTKCDQHESGYVLLLGEGGQFGNFHIIFNKEGLVW